MGRKIDRQALLEAVNECAGLSAAQKEDLRQLLTEQKKYGLVWEDKPEQAYAQLRNIIPVMMEDKSKAIINSAASPNHVIIEGDNLHALTNLAYTHAGKIDVIYIDPPYNTGNKDFVYNDRFVDKNDGFRHSEWLSFMEKRLKLAKQLLSNKGVIFISIDENEVAPLRMLGDGVFGEENFVGQWNWFKSATPPALSKKIKRTVEYILSWKSQLNDYRFQGAKKVSKSNDPFTKPQNTFKTLLFKTGSITCPQQPNGIIPKGTYGTAKFPNELLDDLVVVNGKNANDVRFKNRFIWVQETLDKNINEGLYIELSKKGVLSYKRTEYSPEVPPNFIDSSVGVDTTENAGRYLQDMFENKVVFDYPKPVSLIKYIVNFMPYKDAIILDFFAGSGTTLHATMQLNAEDGGHRQCILVTNNENGICENVTYPRNKKVIEGYRTPKGEWVEGLKDNNLRYFRMDTDSVRRDGQRRSREQLATKMVDMLRLKHNIYTPLDHVGTLPTNPPTTRYYQDGGRGLLILMEPGRIGAFVAAIKEMEIERIYVYVYSDGVYGYEAEFAALGDKVEVNALPTPFLNVFKRVAPPKSDNPIPTPNRELTEQEAAQSIDDYKDTDNDDTYIENND